MVKIPRIGEPAEAFSGKATMVNNLKAQITALVAMHDSGSISDAEFMQILKDQVEYSTERYNT